MRELRVSVCSGQELWDNQKAGQAGYIEEDVGTLASKVNTIILAEGDTKFFLLSQDGIGVVSIYWEPGNPENMSGIATKANVDRVDLVDFLREVFGDDASIVIYPEDYEI